MRIYWKLRACPRCGGDTYLNEEPEDGWQEVCLQCGNRIAIKKVTVQEVGERLFKEVKV